MSQIKGKNTKPEMLVRKFLHANGFRYRLHVKNLPGKPDIVLPQHKTVIFVHGCFWHGHKDCKYFVVPKTRTEWWLTKINSNVANDTKASKALKRKAGRLFNYGNVILSLQKLKRSFCVNKKVILIFLSLVQRDLKANGV